MVTLVHIATGVAAPLVKRIAPSSADGSVAAHFTPLRVNLRPRWTQKLDAEGQPLAHWVRIEVPVRPGEERPPRS
jgi:hypothetical protein